jgi:UDP-GlcNAc:undecaprenyl-phosphate GlcNAc-1-phosphate transferase
LSSAILYLVVERGRHPVVAAAAAFVALLGFLDDRIQLRPLVKFAAQSIAVVAVIAAGVVLRPTGWEQLNILITFLWIAGITNAFNLIDNMDGLCAGVTIIICGFRFWLALQNGDPVGAQFMMILAGAFLGFLIFNYRPAKIFMGDGGSMFAGFVLATVAVVSPVPNTRVLVSSIFYPALTFLYPIFDTVLVSFLRRAANRPITVGGRDHSSHRLASLGLGEQKVVWLLWILTAAGSAAGLLTYWMPIGVLAIGFLLLVGTTVFGVFLGTLPSFEMPETALIRSSWIRRQIPTLRAGVTLVVEILLAGVALLAAFLLRWENAFQGTARSQFLFSLPIVMGCQAIACLGFRTFHLGWRWFGVRDLITLGESVLVGTTFSTLIIWMAGLRGYSRGVIVLYAFFLFSSVTGLRVSLRFFWQMLALPQGCRRAAILGSGHTAGLLVSVLQRNQELYASPVIILATDPAADRTRVFGVPVRFVNSDPVRILREASADMLIVAAGNGFTTDQRSVIDACRNAGLEVAQLEMTMTPLEDAPSVSAPASA